MQRSYKFAAVTGVLIFGLATALIFRKHVPPVGDPDAAPATSPGVVQQPLPLLKPRVGPPLSPVVGSQGDALLKPAPAMKPVIRPGSDSAAATLDVQPPPDLAGTFENSAPASATPRVSLDPSAATPWGKQLAPAVMPTDEPAEDVKLRRHKVTDGDTLSRLAVRYLGSADRYMEIFRANRDVLESPDLLPIGKELVIPSREAASPAPLLEGMHDPVLVPINPGAAQQVSTPTRRSSSYTLATGETLVDVARKVYGDGHRYTDIYEANRLRMRNPQDVRPGLVLSIP